MSDPLMSPVQLSAKKIQLSPISALMLLTQTLEGCPSYKIPAATIPKKQNPAQPGATLEKVAN